MSNVRHFGARGDGKTDDTAAISHALQQGDDCRAGTVREGTIVGNTIQAKQSPGGANVRLLGVGQSDASDAGLLTITGNLLGSQETVLYVNACRGVVVSGNAIYSGYQRAIWADGCKHLVISGNSIDHNPEYQWRTTDAVVLEHCVNVTFQGCIHEHSREAQAPVEASLDLHDCSQVNVTGCQWQNARRRGIFVRNSVRVRIADCTILGRLGDADYRAAVTVDEGSRHVMVVNNFLGKGSAGDLELPAAAGVAAGNM